MLELEALGPQLEYRNKQLYNSIHSSRHVQVFLMYLGNCTMGRNCFLKGIHISMHLCFHELFLNFQCLQKYISRENTKFTVRA